MLPGSEKCSHTQVVKVNFTTLLLCDLLNKLRIPHNLHTAGTTSYKHQQVSLFFLHGISAHLLHDSLPNLYLLCLFLPLLHKFPFFFFSIFNSTEDVCTKLPRGHERSHQLEAQWMQKHSSMAFACKVTISNIWRASDPVGVGFWK